MSCVDIRCWAALGCDRPRTRQLGVGVQVGAVGHRGSLAELGVVDLGGSSLAMVGLCWLWCVMVGVVNCRWWVVVSRGWAVLGVVGCGDGDGGYHLSSSSSFVVYVLCSIPV